jgi:hypothetical protein
MTKRQYYRGPGPEVPRTPAGDVDIAGYISKARMERAMAVASALSWLAGRLTGRRPR